MNKLQFKEYTDFPKMYKKIYNKYFILHDLKQK